MAYNFCICFHPSVYAQLLDRQQQRLELVLIPFIPIAAIKGQRVDDFEWPTAPAYVLYSEQTNVWINVHDILSFFPSGDPNSVMFLWASEETGYRHLYIVKSQLRAALSQNWQKETSLGKKFCNFLKIIIVNVFYIPSF